MSPRPRPARSLGIALAACSAAAAWAAIRLHDPSGGIDPHWSGVGTAGVVVAFFWARAAFALFRLDRGRTPLWAASVWFAAALAGLVVLDAVSFASRLGG